MESFPYDHWQKYQTISGLPADLVISAVQKEIRRNNPENAATLAYEMLITSDELEDYLWYRLRTISVEDVGFGEPMAAVLVNSLDQMRRATKHNGDRRLLAIHAVRYLCACKKDRSSDEMFNWIQTEYKAGNLKPTIPPYAYDKHTLQGQQQGKGTEDFYLVGTVVEPEWEDRDTTYRKRMLELLNLA